MIGAIIGDIAGSPYERHNIKTTDFPLFGPRSRFTDDTVLTVATAEAILRGGDYRDFYREYYRRYPDAGYGGFFRQWGAARDPAPYGSFGNGSAMRVSPVGFACATLEETLREAARSAAVTHDHPEGIRGAQAVASAVFLARSGAGKDAIRDYIAGTFRYDLSADIDWLRKHYTFDVSCQGSVPQAIIAFLRSRDFEDAVRIAVSIGGDSDTIACMCGGIAQAHYGSVPAGITEEAMKRLDGKLRDVIEKFRAAYGC
ncbi:MAG: ADP-ribosylglycohydrolase family protein [Spirochaetes bacterium]|nr:ADP-ribosylglycohydrolase family protein [Spirochaetota bacterium]